MKIELDAVMSISEHISNKDILIECAVHILIVFIDSVLV
jgi:hypothetical protein